MHHYVYQNHFWKFLLQHINFNGKHVIEKWGLEIEIKNVNLKDVMDLHLEFFEALEHIVDNQERESVKLKKRIGELDSTLSVHPLFGKHLAIVQKIEESLGQLLSPHFPIS